MRRVELLKQRHDFKMALRRAKKSIADNQHVNGEDYHSGRAKSMARSELRRNLKKSSLKMSMRRLKAYPDKVFNEHNFGANHNSPSFLVEGTNCCTDYEQYFGAKAAEAGSAIEQFNSSGGIGSVENQFVKTSLSGLGKGVSLSVIGFSYQDALAIGKAGDNFKALRVVEESLGYTKGLRFLGRAVGGVTIGYDLLRLRSGEISTSHFANNTAWTGYGLVGGIPGLLVSASYYVMGDLLGGHKRAKESFDKWQSFTPREKQKEIDRILNARKGGNLPKPVCFVKGTKILMSDLTEKNIEDVKVGESVLSVDESKFEIGPSSVRNVTHFESKKIIKMRLQNNTEIEFTEDHPFWVVDKGWCVFNVELAKKNNIEIEVKSLEKSNLVLFYDKGKLIETKILEIFETKMLKDVYNLDDVSVNSTFFANKTLVHNRNTY